MTDTTSLDIKENVDFLVKAAYGFPSTDENKAWYQEITIPASNYVFGENVFSDTIPSQPEFTTQKQPSDVGLVADDFVSDGTIFDDSTGVIRRYQGMKLKEVPQLNPNKWSFYRPNSSGDNLIAGALQFNFKQYTDENGVTVQPYLYNVSSVDGHPDAMPFGKNGGNWSFDLKSGVLFVPDATNPTIPTKFKLTDINLPVVTIYVYIGNKGVSGGGGGGGGAGDAGIGNGYSNIRIERTKSNEPDIADVSFNAGKIYNNDLSFSTPNDDTRDASILPKHGDILIYTGRTFPATAPTGAGDFHNQHPGYFKNYNYKGLFDPIILPIIQDNFNYIEADTLNPNLSRHCNNFIRDEFRNQKKVYTELSGNDLNYRLNTDNIKLYQIRKTGTTNFGFNSTDMSYAIADNEAILTIGHHQYIEGQEGLIQFPSLKHNGMFKFEHNDDVGNARINFKYESSSADTSARNMMTWNGNGCVGINDDTPSVPLEVKHPHPNTFYWNRHDWGHYFNVFGKSAAGYTHSDNYAIVAMFHGSIASNAFHAQSDERIKCDFEDVSDNEALDIVNKIDCVKYNYKDPLEKRNKKTIGFIAQQVEEHLPNVINKMTRFIPDVLQNVTCDASGFVDYMVDMSDNHTGKCRFYVESMDLEDMSKGILPIDVEYNNGCKLPKHYENVFFWGREVTDFHTLDKNQIFALHHSAIQEMDRNHNKINNIANNINNDIELIKQKLNI